VSLVEVCSAYSHSQRINAGSIHGVLRIDFAVVPDDELSYGIIVLVYHIEIAQVSGDSLSHRVATPGRKG
jgi:hypothetical protein